MSGHCCRGVSLLDNIGLERAGTVLCTVRVLYTLPYMWACVHIFESLGLSNAVFLTPAQFCTQSAGRVRWFPRCCFDGLQYNLTS